MPSGSVAPTAGGNATHSHLSSDPSSSQATSSPFPPDIDAARRRIGIHRSGTRIQASQLPRISIAALASLARPLLHLSHPYLVRHRPPWRMAQISGARRHSRDVGASSRSRAGIPAGSRTMSRHHLPDRQGRDRYERRREAAPLCWAPRSKLVLTSTDLVYGLDRQYCTHLSPSPRLS